MSVAKLAVLTPATALKLTLALPAAEGDLRRGLTFHAGFARDGSLWPPRAIPEKRATRLYPMN